MRLLGMNNSEHETSIDLQSVQNNVGVDLCVHLSVLFTGNLSNEDVVENNFVIIISLGLDLTVKFAYWFPTATRSPDLLVILL